MTKTIKGSQAKKLHVCKEHHFTNFVVKPLRRELKRHLRTSTSQRKLLLKVLQGMDERIEILAQEIARQSAQLSALLTPPTTPDAQD